MMGEYKLTILKSGQQLNITPLVANLSWSDSLDTLGMELNFDVVRNKADKYMVGYDVVNIKDKVLLTRNGTEIFRGILVDASLTQFTKSITALDFAFYLNQSKTVIQFVKMRADQTITQLCNKFNVPIGKITQISTLITKIYKDKTIAEIIKDILNQATQETGIEFRLEMRAGKLYIEKYIELFINGTFVTADVTKQESIRDMKNSVIVTSGDAKSARVMVKAENTASIAEVGLLQEVVSVDDKNTSQAANIAEKQLKLLNKTSEDISLTLINNALLDLWKVRAGRIVYLKNDIYNLNGLYLIKSCNHTYQNNIHKATMNVCGVVLS